MFACGQYRLRISYWTWIFHEAVIDGGVPSSRTLFKMSITDGDRYNNNAWILVIRWRILRHPSSRRLLASLKFKLNLSQVTRNCGITRYFFFGHCVMYGTIDCQRKNVSLHLSSPPSNDLQVHSQESYTMSLYLLTLTSTNLLTT